MKDNEDEPQASQTPQPEKEFELALIDLRKIFEGELLSRLSHAVEVVSENLADRNYPSKKREILLKWHFIPSNKRGIVKSEYVIKVKLPDQLSREDIFVLEIDSLTSKPTLYTIKQKDLFRD